MIAANHTKVAQEGSLVASYKGTLRKKTLFFFLLLAILFILAVYAVAAGTYDLSPLKVISAPKGMGVRPTHFTHLNIYANFINFGTNHDQA